MRNVFDIDCFLATPLVGILRREDEFDYVGMVGALIEGGLSTVEISFTHPAAPRQLAGMVAAAQGRLNIGAGTVTTLERLAAAKAAGATFVVTPALDPEVAAATLGAKLPFFPGAYTPTEIMAAHRMGATMVKLFPAVTLGPAFLGQFKAALPEVRLLPTGGIACAKIPEWKRAGADGLGLGGSLFPESLITSANWSALSAHVRTFVSAWRDTPPS
jgi:2-dehydro-3-deoxyphosphogluconate aldolase/(4S)-4-hydroxy-2-oxoglutarate aldolase